MSKVITIEIPDDLVSAAKRYEDWNGMGLDQLTIISLRIFLASIRHLDTGENLFGCKDAWIHFNRNRSTPVFAEQRRSEQGKH